MSTEITKSHNKMPRAVRSAPLKFGDKIIECAVLEDGTQLITRSSILRFLGLSTGGGRVSQDILDSRAKGVEIPVFLSSPQLIKFIPKELTSRSVYTKFKSTSGAIAKGYNAEIIPLICEAYQSANKANSLKGQQLLIAESLEIVYRALVRVGISGLILEACGLKSEKDFLQNILSKYIAQELQTWTRRFPPHFFSSYKRMYGLSEIDSMPMHIGTFINHKVYKELAPGILEELKKINPKDEDGKRAHAHHQFLTPNKGVVELEKQLIKVCTVMNLSDNRKDFDDKYKKSKELTLT